MNADNPKLNPNRRLARRVRRGATAVEFALTSPILFALCMGAIELSRANMLLNTTAIAATEAARKSIVDGATAADVKAAAMRELGVAGIQTANVVMDPTDIVEDTKQVTVSLTVPVGGKNGYTLARLFLGKAIFKSVTLQREAKTVDSGSESGIRDGLRDDADALKADQELINAAEAAIGGNSGS